MKRDTTPIAGTAVTLQQVIDRVLANRDLSNTRRRDLKSAITTYARIKGVPPDAIALDLAEMRATLEATAPARVNISAKRWANLRSDLLAAVEASGLHPVLRTGRLPVNGDWAALLKLADDPQVTRGLSRFARWASLHNIAPVDVDTPMIARFIAAVETTTIVRNIGELHRSVAVAWNRVCGVNPGEWLPVTVPYQEVECARLAWSVFPASFQNDVEAFSDWCAVPDPLDDAARSRGLAPKTVKLRRDHIHSAVSDAVAAGVAIEELTALRRLVDVETFKALLRHRRKADGPKMSAYTHGMAGTLVAVAAEWVKLGTADVAMLKALRRKLGELPAGLTEKNRALLRQFDDPRVLQDLLALPDKLWRQARQELVHSRRALIGLQTSLSIDVLLNVPLRMENLSVSQFDIHVQWPRGKGRPALITFHLDETKNKVQLDFELPRQLSDRLWVYRHDIVPAVTGKRPREMFVKWDGTPRKQDTISLSIEKAVLNHLGIKLTPHQFRHIAAKIILDHNPGAYELVRQLLGHKNMKTTTNFYAGIDTRRAGRAHADLVMKLKDEDTRRRGRRGKGDREGD